MSAMPTRKNAGATSQSASSSSSSAKYHKMTKVNDGFIDLQFQKPPPRIPYKAIMLASVLFIVGSILIVIASLLLAGYFDVKYSDRTWPLMIIGGLMFIPGAYHIRIAVYAYKGYKGYSYEDIPDFDD